jgi:hypothetical protein
MLGPRFGGATSRRGPRRSLRHSGRPVRLGLRYYVSGVLDEQGARGRAVVCGTAAAAVTAAESRLLRCASSRPVPILRRTSRLAPDDPSTLCTSHIHGTEAVQRTSTGARSGQRRGGGAGLSPAFDPHRRHLGRRPQRPHVDVVEQSTQGERCARLSQVEGRFVGGVLPLRAGR